MAVIEKMKSEESADDIESDKEREPKYSQQDLIAGSPKTANANFFVEELSSDDEILTFQCPEDFDVKSLLNKKLDMNKATKIKENNKKFSCEVFKDSKQIMTCVIPSREKGAHLVKFPIMRHMVIRNVMKVPRSANIVVDNCEAKTLEIANSSSRHPLLGPQWHEHLTSVRKRIKKHKKLLRKTLEYEKCLVKAEKERKEQKKKLKVQLALLKKSYLK